MELRQFIRTSLVDIMRGVQDAQADIFNDPNAKGAVNPAFGELKDTMTRVKFDVAVTVASESKGDVKAGINVYAVKIGGGGSTQTQDSTVSRLAFEVPIAPAALTVTPDQRENTMPRIPDFGAV